MTAYLPKLHNEIRVHCRFSTTKANASARGLEIGIVNFHQLIQVLRRIHLLNHSILHDYDSIAHGHGLRLIVGHVYKGRLQPLMQS